MMPYILFQHRAWNQLLPISPSYSPLISWILLFLLHLMPIYISSECLGFMFISLFKFTQISFPFVELKNKSKVLCWVLPLGIFSSQRVLLRLATFLLADQLQHTHTAHQNKYDCFQKVSEGLEFGSLIHFYYWNTVSLSVVDAIQNHFLWEKVHWQLNTYFSKLLPIY